MEKRDLLIIFTSLLFLVSCNTKNTRQQGPDKELVMEALPGEKIATFAGGCFWCTEEIFENIKGVQRVLSGYAGGPEPDPDYEAVSAGRTGHAETIQIYYDTAAIDYPTLLKVFFLAAHDPTQKDRQGPDVGEQYRSIVFYRDAKEKETVTSYIKQLDASGKFGKPIVTQVVPFEKFYPAEGYHQDYYPAHPEDPYIQQVSKPKVEKFKKQFKYLLKSSYSAANAHSHNDYEQDAPFQQAYDAGFGSIEADIFLEDGELYVAHNLEDIDSSRTLKAVYIEPIAAAFRDNKGRAFQLLVDVKTAAAGTLPVLTEQLGRHPELFDTGKNAHAVSVVISGNRPAPESWPDAPSFIYFDGRPAEVYSAAALKKTGLISDSFGNYSEWDGTGPVSETDRKRLAEVVQKAHDQGKPFRFWAVPDTPEAWELMTELGVDFINTDTIKELASWLEKR